MSSLSHDTDDICVKMGAKRSHYQLYKWPADRPISNKSFYSLIKVKERKKCGAAGAVHNQGGEAGRCHEALVTRPVKCVVCSKDPPLYRPLLVKVFG